jgi:hypothetical protein
MLLPPPWSRLADDRVDPTDTHSVKESYTCPVNQIQAGDISFETLVHSMILLNHNYCGIDILQEILM